MNLELAISELRKVVTNCRNGTTDGRDTTALLAIASELAQFNRDLRASKQHGVLPPAMRSVLPPSIVSAIEGEIDRGKKLEATSEQRLKNLAETVDMQQEELQHQEAKFAKLYDRVKEHEVWATNYLARQGAQIEVIYGRVRELESGNDDETEGAEKEGSECCPSCGETHGFKTCDCGQADVPLNCEIDKLYFCGICKSSHGLPLCG